MPQAIAAAASAAPGPRKFRPDIIEVGGRSVEDLIRNYLSSWERHAAGSIKAGNDSWAAHVFLAPGAGPEHLADPAWAQGDTDKVTFLSPPPADAIAARFRRFCNAAFGLVERQLHSRLADVWVRLGALTHGLRWHCIMTLTRTAPNAVLSDRECPVRADSFDGTLAAVALVSDKMGTPTFPAAEFAEPPLELFVRDSAGLHGRSLSVRLAEGPSGRPLKHAQREWRDSTLVIMPPTVAHSIPPGRVWDFEGRSSDGRPLADKDAPRWFARITLEIVPARGGATDGDMWQQHHWRLAAERAAVATLVAEHVWGDPDFAAEARQLFAQRLHGFAS